MFNVSLLDLLPEWMMNWLNENYAAVIFVAFTLSVVLILVLHFMPVRSGRSRRRSKGGGVRRYDQNASDAQFARSVNRSIERNTERAHFRSRRY